MESSAYTGSAERSLFVELMEYAPDASTFSGMFFYSFVVFLILSCLRKLRNDTIYPRMANSVSEASRKQRE